MSTSSRQNISFMYDRSVMNKDKLKKENNSSVSQSVLGPSGALSQSNFHKRINNYKTGTQNMTMRRFGTEITNTSSSSTVLHHEAVKKTNGLKNKFLDKPITSFKRDDGIANCQKLSSVTQQNWNKNNIAVEEPEDVEMDDTQEVEECKYEQSSQDNEEKQLQDIKDVKASRRKVILKELEVCDLLDLRNPQYVAEYSTNIYHNMKGEEDEFLIDKDFLNDTEIEERHRRRLVEWLSEVHNKFRLLPETFFITTKLVDLSIQKFGVKKSNLQLLSLGALLISTKYEEIYPPSVRQMLKVAANETIKKEDVLEMEYKILRSLNFGVVFPTPLRFLERVKKLVNVDDITFNLAHYIIQFSMLYICFQTIKPSLVACGAMYLSMKSLRARSSWNITYYKSTGYKERLVQQVAEKLCELMNSAESKALKHKFATEKYSEVSNLPITMG
jgi:hypothetical protein